MWRMLSFPAAITHSTVRQQERYKTCAAASTSFPSPTSVLWDPHILFGAHSVSLMTTTDASLSLVPLAPAGFTVI